MTDEELGREHAIACFTRPKTFDLAGPRTPEYANAALAELERLQRDAPGMIEALLDGGNQGAKQLNADSKQGLREIVQNADDLGATTVRFGVRTKGGQHQLLIVHDGAPVDLLHVLPIIYPFLSTKRGRARLKGRFGVGLKTLSRLGSDLTVHSAPFHFSSRDNLATQVPSRRAIPSFYDPATETLFTLNLDSEVEVNFLADWFADWSPSDLIFLDTVRSVTLHDFDAESEISDIVLSEIDAPHKLSLMVEGAQTPAERRRFRIEGSLWERYVAHVAVPTGKRRDGKATDETTPIGVAVPVDGDAHGRIHVALPTRISTHAAFSLDAQFDPATSREELVDDPWNRWLVRASSEMIGSLAIHLAHQKSPLAWFVVPVGAATDSTSTWLNDRIAAEWQKAVRAFASDDALIGAQPDSGLANLAYCNLETEGLLDSTDHVLVTGLAMLPLEVRDTRGRWRDVLDTIGESTRVGLEDVLESCADDRFDGKQAIWFLDLATRCLKAECDVHLLDARWVPLADGGRAWARDREEADELLVMAATEVGLVARHQLCLAVTPLLADEQHEAIWSWLAEEANLVADLRAFDILGAFAARYADAPCEASREDLLAIRDLFALVEEREPVELGLKVGRALLIEAFRYDVGPGSAARSTRHRALPADVYLSASIEDEPDGWSRAAAETPDLLWALPAYAEVFKVARRSAAGARSSRIRAAKRFLLLLGAATTPRLEKIDTPVGYGLPPLQAPARHRVGQAPGILKDDHVSPDLDRVVADILAGSEKTQRRRGRRQAEQGRNRGVALFRCIASNWTALEECSSTNAIRVSRRGGYLVEVPATWVARLAEEPWLVNETGVATRPRGLAIATKVTSAIYDDPAMFAAGLSMADAASPFARALEMDVEPPASELVRAVERMRDDSTLAERGDILRLYRALAGHCPQGGSVPSPDARVGDMTVGSLRAKFGISRSRRGLIASCSTTKGGDNWFAPTTVFSGKDVFHGRCPFVIADRDLAPLWNALNIAAPNVADCVRQLELVGRETAWLGRDALLIDVYRHIDRLVERASAADRRALSHLPLLSGGRWLTFRPIYFSDYLNVAVKGLQIWSAPCAVGTIRNFVRALGVEQLPVENRPVSPSYGAPEELQARFETALRILRADLARDDERSYRAMEPWPRFVDMLIHIHPTDKLIVRAAPKGGRPLSLAVRAHADVAGCAVHVDADELIGRFEYGGHAVAQFANDRHREVAMAWVSAWATSADEMRSGTIELAEEEAAGDLDELAAQFDRLKRSGGRRRMSRTRETGSDAGGVQSPEPEVRRLKDVPSDFGFDLVFREGDDDARKGLQDRPQEELRNEPKKRDKSCGKLSSKVAPVTAHRMYDSRQLQERAWVYVRMAIEDGHFILDDLQAERGVGADGAIEWKTFVEMKCFSREAPAEVTLTEAEYRRAKQRNDKFLLVVVSGLEEGFNTEIRIYSNPLATLPWTPKGSVSIGGLARGRAVILSQARIPISTPDGKRTDPVSTVG